MQLTVLRSKLQSVVVTGASLDYRGSITIDEELMEAANLKKYEMVHVNSTRNGARIITYVIPGTRGSGEVCVNGAAALHFQKGDVVHVLAFAHIEYEEADDHQPLVILTDKENKLIEVTYY